MSVSLISGLTLTILGAVFAGALGLLLRLQKRYAWENTWLLSQLVAMILLPTIAAQLLLSHWSAAIRMVPTSIVLIVIALGFMWGIGSVAFAIGIDRIGLSLGYAMIMGVVTSVGAGIPMIRKWDAIPHQARIVTLCGIGVCLVGVALYGRAGLLRERGEGAPLPDNSSGTIAKAGSKVMIVGLSWCLLSGILSACSNIGFDFAAPIASAVERMGAKPLSASLVRWIPVFWGGYLAVILFSGVSLLRKRTWENFTKSGTGLDFIRAVGLGTLSFVAQWLYGMGASELGLLGTSVGYAVFLALSIIVALVFGFMLGEWKHATRRSLHVLYVGAGVLIAAVVILAYGSSLTT
jgi:L-rhamnose-H+ transport protein